MSRTQRLTLLAAIVGTSVVMLDGSIVNVALPAIERDLGGGLAAQQWVVNAYLLLLGSFILVGGSLGDIYGERKVFGIGVAAFGICSLGCAIAPDIGVLIAARALQGVAGAMVTPSSLAVIVAAFPADRRGGAIGAWTAWTGISAVAGPLLGGWIVDFSSWRWVFAINVPLVIATITLVVLAVAHVPPVADRRLDLAGAALCALGLGGVMAALIEQPHRGWGSPLIFGLLIAGVALFIGFVVYERRAAHPMLKLELFASRNFTAANIETLVMYGGLSILLFFLVIFLQQVAGYSALRSGLTTLPITIVMFVLSSRFGALSARLGPRLFMGGGPIVAAAGVLWLLRAGLHTSYLGVVFPALLLFGLGLSITVAPLTTTVLAEANDTDAGIASAINNAVARVAGLVGIGVVGVVVAHTLVGDSFHRSQSSVHAFHQAVIACVVCLVVAGTTGALGIRNPSRNVEKLEVD
ncbi:MAG TPA: DHA2 family efflux MFS transporter permease subunit [Mycobacteriales bacterium]|nr:DHA2 family efflux MFS transporter permease subunit [Mycobacteriales bacterium]